jgi:ribokinase
VARSVPLFSGIFSSFVFVIHGNCVITRSMPEIIVIGSLNADLVVRAPRFPAPGETISGEDLSIIPGGKGANQAVAAARQGVSVAMVGRVGGDSFGPTLIQNLQDNHVDTTRVQKSESATGTATIIVDSSGQNSIVLSPGANGLVTPADVESVSFQDAELLLLQLEIPLEAVVQAASLARQNGLRVILNPAPARQLPDSLLSDVDILVPNESELQLLSGQPVTDPDSAKSAAQVLLEKGVKTIIVTLGSNGALLVTGEKTVHVPAFTVEVVDTTAAGDAFIGGLAAALLKGKPLEEAVRYGNASGALAATKFGAQPSLPTLDEVEQVMSLRAP